MILPDTYAVALFLAILAAFCWGSWANTYKLARKQRFELFYWDYALGAVIAALVAALTFGSLGFDMGGDVAGFAFRDDLMRSSKHSWFYGLAAGGVFNLGGILLMASMSLAGMSLALPVGLGLTAGIAVLVRYLIKPDIQPVMVFSALMLIFAAVVLDLMAYRAVSLLRAQEAIKTGKTKSTKLTASWKPIVFALIGGPLIALSWPLVELSRVPDTGMGPYAAAFMFSIGVFVSTAVYNLFFMNLPVKGEPLELLQYLRQPVKNHLLPLLGGMIWAAGTVALFAASSATAASGAGADATPLLGSLTGQAVIAAAALLGALWGVLVWREYASPSARVRGLAMLMLILLAGALVLILVAPQIRA